MDPQETLERLTDALNCEDWIEAMDAAQNLIDWHNRGGFCPVVGWDQLGPLVDAANERAKLCNYVQWLADYPGAMSPEDYRQ